MPNRSQRHLREEGGKDSSGWDGKPIIWTPPVILEALLDVLTADAQEEIHFGPHQPLIDVHVTATLGGVLQQGVTVFAESSDRDVATSEASDVTSGNGIAKLKLFNVDPGECYITYSAVGYASQIIHVIIP